MTNCAKHKDHDPKCKDCSWELAEFWLDVWGWDHTEDNHAWGFRDAVDEFINRTLGITWEAYFETPEDIILNPDLMKLYAFKAWQWAEEQGCVLETRNYWNLDDKEINSYIKFMNTGNFNIEEYSVKEYGKARAIMLAAAEVMKREEKGKL